MYISMTVGDRVGAIVLVNETRGVAWLVCLRGSAVTISTKASKNPTRFFPCCSLHQTESQPACFRCPEDSLTVT
jgi:hypothetical protein